LYAYPGPTWISLLGIKAANPSLPIVAVINPSNGPGSWSDPNYLSWIRTLQGAGITVLGYVYTVYGERSIASVESDIANYRNWYGLSGIYIDQMANWAGLEWYYSTLTSYGRSLGMWLTIGNPGADVLPSYIGTVDCLVIFENHGEPSLSFLGGWHTGYGKNNFAVIGYGVDWLDSWFLQSSSSYLQYIYLTDENMPNPYLWLSSYVDGLAATLLSSSSSGSTSATLTVQSQTVDGSSVNGLWTVLSSSGNSLATGFTPMSYSVTVGTTYQISAADYGNYIFDHWDDGSASRTRGITASQTTTTLTAYYRPFSSTLTVQSADMNGNAIGGLWTEIQSNGAVVASGFTPLSLSMSSGNQYFVTVGTYQGYTFNHWADWSTSDTVSVSGSASATLTAYYST
jgi:hypothetical protein